ncbi:hypothetical protein ID854_19355 [Xenorhabdus sp. M]|uniref:DUF6708 domain-containing protein n=1 Tax=Xenorhabdus szentirmaii TaxID=290112 RepID=A0AAW3YZZ9_9GAMM|nr:DUF6708 domain-containing protein [Xenorhabdus sp. M]MBD2802534.1 hypothetical protein [Xenorhabdus sp. M]
MFDQCSVNIYPIIYKININELISKNRMSHLTGLYTPYSVNRPLTQQEKVDQLHQGQQNCEIQRIRDKDTVIKMNSTYLETVDRYYVDKGNASLLTFTMFSIIIGFIIYGTIIVLERYFYWDTEPDVSKIMPPVIMFAAMIFFCVKWTLKEWFRKTHYPIRFNRNNKMIYVYQVNGQILSIPWNEVFFTYAKGKGAFPEWGIDGHILADDKETVLQTFSLGFYGSKYELSGYWEFIRCYMEEDVVKELAETIVMCPPVADWKEGYKFGLQYSFRLCSRFDRVRFIVLPIILLESISRYIAMKTSKIPQ